MTSQHAYRTRTIDIALVREYLAVVLILAGLIGLVTVAFMVDVRAGAAAVSTLAIVAGVFLGLDRRR